MHEPQRNLLFLNLAHGYDHFFLLIFPTAALALQRSWDASYGEVLALGTPAFAAFALATLPCGWLGDRWSRRHMMTTFFVGIGLASILAGLAQGPLSLAAALAVLGLFAAIYHPVGTAMVVQLAPRAGQALGINGVFGNMGVAAAPLITALLIETAGWRAAFILPGIVAIATGLVFARIATPALDRPAAAAARAAVAPSRPVMIRVFVVVATTALFGGFIFHGTTIALPKLFEERLGALTTSLSHIGLLAGAVFALASFAQIVVGRMLDRVGARRLMLLLTGLQVPCLILVAELWGWPAVFVAGATMLVVFGEIPIGAWLVGRYAAAHWHSRIYGLVYVLSLGVSALVVPVIAIVHGLSGGLEVLFLMLAGSAAVIFAAAWLLPRHRAAMPATGRTREGTEDMAARVS
jgi:MFS family permease